MQLFLLRVTISWALFAVVAMAGISPLLAADPARKSEAPKVLVIGYSDANLDGVNDRFRDANGDGVDDVSGKPYPHRFLFVDQDGDGTNDLFVDQDGDGVNDLEAQYKDSDGDGICDNVIDFDGDGINDITGEKYDRHSLKGYRFGRVDEERGIIHRRFIDEDRDGMNDLIRRFHPPPGPGPRMDHFIDEDGDGIADGRRLHPPMAGSPLMERLRGRPKPDGRPKQPPPRPRRHPPRDRKGGR
jgi:hypothetical protein